MGPESTHTSGLLGSFKGVGHFFCVLSKRLEVGAQLFEMAGPRPVTQRVVTAKQRRFHSAAPTEAVLD